MAVTLSQPPAIKILNSFSNQSETVNDLLVQYEEYQHWLKAYTGVTLAIWEKHAKDVSPRLLA
jgi:hypothetical protein